MSPGRINEATFASTNLRWALLLQDHPEARRSYAVVPGAELDIPAEYGADLEYVVCTIAIAGREPATGHKEMKPGGGGPEDWKKVRTSALGSALKSAGYPDNLPDLKAVILWRQRMAEIAAIANGHTTATPAPIEAALDEAETHDPDDDGDEPVEVEQTAGDAPQGAAETESPVNPSEDGDRTPSASEPDSAPTPSSDPSPVGRAATPTAPLPAGDQSDVGGASRGSGAPADISEQVERAKLLITSLSGQKPTKAYLTYRRENKLPLTVEEMGEKQVADLIAFLEPLHASAVPS